MSNPGRTHANVNLFLALLLGAVVGGGGAWLPTGSAACEGAAVARPSAPAAQAPAPKDLGPGAPARTGEETPAAGEEETPSSPSAALPIADLEAEQRRLEDERASLEERADALRPKPVDPSSFRFGVPEKAPSFDAADWKELATHMKALGEMLRQVADGLESGKPVPPALVARIRKENMPLALFAGSFGGDVGDSTPNGAFTHPAVIANFVRALLEDAGQPLSSEQQGAIEGLGRAAVLEEKRVEEGFRTTTPEIAKTAALTDARLHFVASLSGVLTETQRKIVFPPESAGRLKLDLLSPALVYVISAPVEAKDREGLQENLLRTLFKMAGVERDETAALDWVARQWVDEIPGVLEPRKRDRDLFFPTVEACQVRAKAQAAAIGRLIATQAFDAKEAEALRAMGTLLFPYVPGT